MKRNNFQKADAILTGDWHLREDQPECRTDDFQKTQWKKVLFVKELQEQHQCPVLHSGDLFHHWKPSPWLLSKAMECIPECFYSVAGNHDLPQHNMDLFDKSGMYCLNMAGKINVDLIELIYCTNFVNFGEVPFCEESDDILLWHIMTYQTQIPFIGCISPKARNLLIKYPSYKLIVTGDNHKPFVESYQGRLLVNPGSLTRQRASETHEPRVYLWYADSNTVKPVYLPTEKDYVSREHLEKVEERDERIDAFVDRLNDDWDKTLNFEENLERFFQKNNINDNIKQIIYKSLILQKNDKN